MISLCAKELAQLQIRLAYNNGSDKPLLILAKAKPMPARKSGQKSKLEESLLFQIRCAGLPEPIRQLQFWRGRKFRFDFAWKLPRKKIAVEVNGGQFVPGGGRHNRGSQMEKEYEKLNGATLRGWKVIQVCTSMVHNGAGLAAIEKAIKGGKAL